MRQHFLRLREVTKLQSPGDPRCIKRLRVTNEHKDEQYFTRVPIMQFLLFAGCDRWNRNRKYHHPHQAGFLSSRSQTSVTETAVSKPESAQSFIWTVEQLISIRSTCLPGTCIQQSPDRLHTKGLSETYIFQAKIPVQQYLCWRGTLSAFTGRQVERGKTWKQ